MIKYKNYIIIQLFVVGGILSACNPLGQIKVSKIVNPDEVAPNISFVTTAPATINGAQNFPLEFEVNDNSGGSGVKEVVLMYSPDGDNLPFEKIGSFPGGHRTINFCPPNKNHPKPAFKITARDKNKNASEATLGLSPGLNFTLVKSPPNHPVVSSNVGTQTNEASAELLIDACKPTACSGDALYYEDPSEDIYIAVAPAQPGAADPAWISCSDVLDDGYTLPAFTGDGDFTYQVWTRIDDTEMDGTPFVSISPGSTDITISRDGTPPAVSFVTANGAMNSHSPFSLSFNVSDATSGLDNAKIFYSPDSTDLSDYPFVEIGSLNGGTPETINFCVPNKTHPSGAFRIEARDASGNVNTVTHAPFTITKTANPLLPAVTSMSLATPATGGSSRVRIDACKQHTCAAGSLFYETPDNSVYIAVKGTQPGASDPEWVSCADVLANGYSFNFPAQVGSGTYSSSLWVKSKGKDIDGTTDVETVSTSSVALSLPYDYTSPGVSNLDLGNLGANKNLEILGTNILTGYSRGSFRLSPSCIDPATIPAIQTYITGTVSVAANNVKVYGTGTSFTTEFAPYDYTEIKGIYTQIKSIESDTEMTLNEISGNNPGLVGTGLQAARRMDSYGGILVNKGAAPAATSPEWQPCDSINQSVTYADLVNGANNLRFWIKDRGNNVSTAFIPYTVNYNAPILSVVNGPTVSTEVADITINACGGGTRITQVLFNETGVQPLASDSSWQNCSTAIGALKSMSLSPGNHVLKAYFKYNDGFISLNPVNVPVNYLPQVAWVEDPLSIRPQLTFTLASCTGVDEVFVNQDVAPSAAAAGWQTCTTAVGGVNYTLATSGTQTVNVWYKSGTTVSPDFSQVEVNFIPPMAYFFGGSLYSITRPPITVDTCDGVSRLFIKLDDASATAPVAGDFSGAGGVNCSTAMNGIIPPAVAAEGTHTYDVWYQFSDGYILSPWHSRLTFTYTIPDTTAPPVTALEGATSPLSLYLENGDGDGSVPGATETIESYGSRASFTLNTCSPISDVALTGTVTVASNSKTVTGSGTAFSTELSSGDFIRIGTQSLKIETVNSNTSLTLILNHTAGASGVAATKVYPEDVITGMMLSLSPVKPASADPFWLTCDTTVGALKTPSLTDGTYAVYAWFKDNAGNVSNTALTKNIIIDTTPDTTPPPRPPVIVEGAPTLTSAPAQLTITSCADVDQVYVEPSKYPDPYVTPSAGLSGWQNCSTAIGAITYYLDLAGSYTLSVWFKDAAGNINDTPRDVSFIFNPNIGNLPNPVAYWTMDKTHLHKNRVIDAKGSNHLYRWSPSQLTEVTGRNKGALKFSGTNSFLFTENSPTLKPGTAVTVSLWAWLTKNDAATKGLAGNGSYGLKLQGGNLSFFASGEGNAVGVPTSSYESGWRHVIGTSDGRYLKLYIDGRQVSTTLDLGSASNLVYGSSQLFVVGGLPDGALPNPRSTNLFDEKIDEVVVWNEFFTDKMAMDHYIDAFNNYKVKQDSVKPADIASASFYGEFLQNALLTINSCGDAKFIYTNVTTHPPTVDSPDWQLCTTVKGGVIHPNLSQGAHELKIWAKDEYDNISAGYLKLNTTISGITYQAPGSLYYTLDNNHNSILSSVIDIFSGQTGTGVNTSFNQAAIQNEGYLFVRASSSFIERKYAFNSQPENEVSLSVWANLTSSDNRRQVLAGTRGGSHGYALEIDQVSNQLRFVVETNGGSRHTGVTTSSYSSGFHNVIGTYDGRHVRLYIDGDEVANTDYLTSGQIKYDCLGSFIVGAGSSCNNGPVAGTHFDNKLDEIVVWNTALSSSTVYDFFNGQDTVPPAAVPVTPKDNEYTIGIPIARLNVSDCADIASVYVSLDGTKPLADIANWQACSETGDLIKSPLLANGLNTLRVWFRDFAGNVSDASYDLDITHIYDFTIPEPKSYWTLDNVNVDGEIAYDVVNSKNGVISGASSYLGIAGEGRIFDGVDDLIEVSDDASFRPLLEVSLGLWFKAPSFGVPEKVLAGNLNNGGYALVLSNNQLEFRVTVGGVVEKISTPVSGLSVSDWHHAVGVYNNGVLRLFLNNTEVLPAVNVAAAVKNIEYNNSNSFTIAAAAPVATGNNGNFFAGQLDEVAFWDVALSDTVVAEMYERGLDGDQIYYDVEPPSVPTNLNITYYNSLVSRANLTINSCAGLDYVIVTKDEFPPDKNDENWQRCNTLVGGLLSQELSTNESFGKLWTKDNAGNVSRSFEYVPITTPYDKPISRPVVHWTFDNAHYVVGTRTAYDRLSQINLKSETLRNSEDEAATCKYVQVHNPSNGSLQTNQAGVLNQAFRFGIFNSHKNPSILRVNHPENTKLKPTDKLSVSAWVYITGNSTSEDKHIVSNLYNNKGWALRLHAPTVDSRGLRFTVYTTQGMVEPYLETKNIATGWHLVTGTFDGQSAALFMDGIFVKSFSLPAPGEIVYEPGVNTFIGSQASLNNLPSRWETYNDTTPCVSMLSPVGNITNNSYYENLIDEVIVWDKSLSKLEVSSLYHNGADILYSTDTIPPTLPTLALENTRPDMFSNKAYFSLSTCNLLGPLNNVISGVLVNEGTRPDKQDERWESCRDRLGSFGIENLTPGGHTITTWFKDLAGNVTPVSADLVVNYIEGAFASANAVWPLDATHNVSKYSRDVIDNKVHDLQMVNIETPLNPLAIQVPAKVGEGLHLASTSSTNGAFLSATSTKLLRPVNFLSVGGWFYLTNADATPMKVLIDQHTLVSGTNRNGYKLYISGGQLRYTVELDIAATQNLATPMTGITTGWHHIVGIFTGNEVKLYVDGTQVASSGILAERDFVRYDTHTDFRIGAESENNTNPASFFGEKVDEIALWGFDLTPSQLNGVVNAGNSNTHIYASVASPSNVDNAFIYHYDNFGSRARMTILNCTNTPYIYVTQQDAPRPAADDPDWRNCRTEPGAIISAKLPVETAYVDVYAKNTEGVISSSAGRKEILPILYDYDLVLPITYLSFNQNQATTAENDFIINARGNRAGSTLPSRQANADGHSLQFTGIAGQYVDIPPQKIFDLREGISLAVWADITQNEASSRTLVRRNGAGEVDDTRIMLQSGELRFYVNVPAASTYNRSTVYPYVAFPTSLIPTGRHFVVATYDGYNMRLYLDSTLVATSNPSDRNYAPNAKRIIDMNGIGGFTLGESYIGKLDEFMVFDRVLDETQIVAWFRRYNDVLNPGDTTPPALGRNISVTASTFGTDWPTDNESPTYTINDCTDINAVFVSTSALPPEMDDIGWQSCRTVEGYLQGPTLTAGNNTVYFYYRDANGNVSAAQQVPVNYNVPVRPDPVSYWNMDDRANIGMRNYEPVNQLHAHTYGILPADYTTGAVGRGIQFDGTRKYVEINHSPIIKPTDELSVSFWMNISGNYNDRNAKTIIGNRGPNREGFMFRWSCSPLTFPFDGNAANTACGPSNLNTHEFFEFVINVNGTDHVLDYPQNQMGIGTVHIVGTFDGRFIKLYRNGTLIKKKDLISKSTIHYDPGNTSLVIGARASAVEKPAGEYFRGVIDEVAIYNKALYSAHVSDIYTNFIQTPAAIYNPGLAVITPPNGRAKIYEPGKKSFGNRLKLTINDCSDMNMVLVNDSLTQPTANDENWQPCNTLEGGILSAPLTSNSVVTPRVWAKSFTGTVSAASGTANNESYNLASFGSNVPRPKVIWTLDSTYSGHTVAPLEIRETLSDSNGTLGALGPTPTMIPVSGFITIAAGTDSVTGIGTSFTSELSPRDRIKIGNETVQIKTIHNDTSITLETNHLAGIVNGAALKLGSINSFISVIEGGYRFNGVSDLISVKPTAATNAMYDLTISAWAELKKGETLHRHIVGNHQNNLIADGAGAGLRIRNNELQFYVTAWTGTARQTYVVGVDTNIYASGMHHIVGTYDGRDLKLYLDGVFVKSYGIPFFNASRYELYHDDHSHWSIGAETDINNAGALNSFFDGVIDEINIWHTPLTEQQIYYVYEYGSFYLPTAVPDGIPPSDPGIYLANGMTTSNSPWAFFTMPSCTGANGIEINAIYVNVDPAPAPQKDDTGWQFCTLDASYIISSLLERGTSTINIYFRDEEGDISAVPTSFTFTYNPPALIQPKAYYTFDDADRSGNFYYYDKAGTKHIRAVYSPSYSPISTGKVGKSFQKTASSYTSSLADTYRQEYDMEKDYSVAFWYYPTDAASSESVLLNQGQFRITRTTADIIKVYTETAWGNYATSSKSRIVPNTWNHIAAVRNNNSVSIYINGRLNASGLANTLNLASNTQKLLFADIIGNYDELVMYDSALTPEQIAYIYFKGEKSESIDVFVPNLVAAPSPDFYWNFDNANFADPYLNSETNPLSMRATQGVTFGNADAKVGQSFTFQRFEDTLNPGGEAQNSIGRHQYLESDTAAPLALGSEFTISLWVKQPVTRGHNASGGAAAHNDSTAIIDMWGADTNNRAFQLSYSRGVSASAATSYTFKANVSGFEPSVETHNIQDSFGSNTGWVHLAIRRKGRIISFFVNGIESSSSDFNSNLPVSIPALTRFRIGDSSLYSYYHIPGTVSVTSGSATVTGTSTQFLNDLFEQKTGTVDIVPGSATVTGTGTLFTTQFNVGNRVKINGTYHTILSITHPTEMILSTPHVAGASGDVIQKQTTNHIRIGLNNYLISNIVSDTQLTLSAASTASYTNEKLGLNINSNNAAANDEYGFNGSIDELAIWTKALTQRQIYDLRVRGETGTPVPVDPVASLVAINGGTTVSTSTARIKLNDCGGYSHVWIGFQTDPDPSSTDSGVPGWVACNSNNEFETPVLTADAVNNLRVWFRNGGTVSMYTFDIPVTHSSGDTTPPVIPVVTKVTSDPTSDSFARFTITSCTDIAGVFIKETGTAPLASASGWQNCTTTASAFQSQPLVSGANNVSFWFKDSAGNVTASTDFTITHNPPAITNPTMYLTMDDDQISASTFFQREIMNNELARGYNTANLISAAPGMVNQGVEFKTNSYYEMEFYDPGLTNTLSFMSWVNIAAPVSDSHIIGKWDGTPANDSFAVRIDSTGRLCLDFQTTDSTGVWNTSAYKRICTITKITFAKWSHIGVVRNGNNVRFYINNKLAGNETINSADFHTSTLGLRIGAQNRNSIMSPVEGILDELALWNSVLTDNEREAIYAKGLKAEALRAESVPVTPGTAPDHYWTFESGTPLAAVAGTVDLTTNTGAVHTTAGGQITDFYSFAGSSLLRTTAPTDLNLGTDFTMSFWVKRAATITAGTIINKWSASDTASQEFQIAMNASGQIVFKYFTTAAGTLTTTQALNTSWSHVTVSRRGPELYLYINGVPQAYANIGTDPLVSVATVPLSIGGNSVGSNEYFNGSVDDVVIYKTYLNERKIRFNIEKGIAGQPLIP